MGLRERISRNQFLFRALGSQGCDLGSAGFRLLLVRVRSDGNRKE
jgi:hypothetical protein